MKFYRTSHTIYEVCGENDRAIQDELNFWWSFENRYLFFGHVCEFWQQQLWRLDNPCHYECLGVILVHESTLNTLTTHFPFKFNWVPFQVSFWHCKIIWTHNILFIYFFGGHKALLAPGVASGGEAHATSSICNGLNLRPHGWLLGALSPSSCLPSSAGLKSFWTNAS